MKGDDRMRWFIGLLMMVAAAGVAGAQPPASLPRGANPSPPQKVFAAKKYPTAAFVPKEFAVVPPRLSWWLNNVTGSCVTAEEAFAKGWWSVRCGLEQTFIPDQEVGRWAKKYNYYNGATLVDVMDTMQVDGFTVDGVNYKDGPYYHVDFTKAASLQTAISEGCVKLGIDSEQLPANASERNGWYRFGGGRFHRYDHAVALTGYGSARFCFEQLGVPTPAGIDPEKPDCYMLFTWKSIGVVDLPWIISAAREAWVRVPTTPGQAPPPPPPDPVPPAPAPFPDPVPLPDGWPAWLKWAIRIVIALLSTWGGFKAGQAVRRSMKGR